MITYTGDRTTVQTEELPLQIPGTRGTAQRIWSAILRNDRSAGYWEGLGATEAEAIADAYRARRDQR